MSMVDEFEIKMGRALKEKERCLLSELFGHLELALSDTQTAKEKAEDDLDRMHSLKEGYRLKFERVEAEREELREGNMELIERAEKAESELAAIPARVARLAQDFAMDAAGEDAARRMFGR